MILFPNNQRRRFFPPSPPKQSVDCASAGCFVSTIQTGQVRARLVVSRDMAVLDYNEITIKKIIELEGEPYEVLSSHVFRKQMRKAVNQTKLRNLISGRVVERTFHQSERADEAEIDSRKVKYLYNNRGEWWFCEENDPSKRFQVEESVVGPQGNYLRPNTLVEILTFGETIVGFKMPIKMELTVKSAPPAVRGDTAQGGVKQITLETGVVINVPLFVNEGDVIRVNTETGTYVERVEKK